MKENVYISLEVSLKEAIQKHLQTTDSGTMTEYFSELARRDLGLIHPVTEFINMVYDILWKKGYTCTIEGYPDLVMTGPVDTGLKNRITVTTNSIYEYVIYISPKRHDIKILLYYPTRSKKLAAELQKYLTVNKKTDKFSVVDFTTHKGIQADTNKRFGILTPHEAADLLISLINLKVEASINWQPVTR